MESNNPQTSHGHRYEEKSYRLEKRRFIFEIIAVTVIFAYTVIQGWQLWVIRDQERRQLRAYVLVNESSIIIDASNNVHARIQIKNSGLTPAYKVAGWGCLFVGRFEFNRGVIGLETDLPNGMPNDPSAMPKSIIGPGNTKVKTGFSFCDTRPFADRPLTSDERNRLREGTAAVYMYGEQTYIDAFGEDRFIKYRVVSNDRLANGVGDTIDDARGNDAN